MLIEKIVEAKQACVCGCGQSAGTGKRFVHGHHAKGKGNGRWNGGTRVVSGYPHLWMPGHPRAVLGYVPEHLLVAEKALGRFIPKEVEVHHINEVRSDSRNANLVICEDHAYHFLLHRRAKAYRACGNANAGFCRFCKRWEVGMDSDNRGTRYHKACQAQYDKVRHAR